MKVLTLISGLAAGMLYPWIAVAEKPDTSEWKCEYCPFEAGLRAEYEAGAGVVSDEAARFANGTGYEEGGYLVLDGQGRYSGEQLSLSWALRDLGLDSRDVSVALENPGRYQAYLSYRGMPHRLFDTTETIFSDGQGGLTLPSGFTRSALTSGMANLGTSLVGQNIETDRDVLQVGARFRPSTRLRLFLDYRHQEQDGVDEFGGSFFTQAALLPRRVDYQTDEVDAGIRYQAERGYAELGVYGSFFQNQNSILRWENPFTALPGAEAGALAEPPDNSFTQVSLRAGYRIGARTRLHASAALGSMEQDDALLGYTINPNINVGALPRSQLDGDVDTTNLHLSVTSRPLSRVALRFDYRYDERDNGTPQEVWSRVIVDSLQSGDAETNLPYSFERTRVRISGDVRALDDLWVGAGFERREFDRDFQEVASQDENTGWGQLRFRPNRVFELRGKIGTSKREVDRYDTALATSLGQNPLLRKYHLAHRFREFGELQLSASLPEKPLSLSANVTVANDDYSQSVLGLLDSDDLRYGADVSWSFAANSNLYVSAAYQEIDAEQAGSSGFSTVDWRARHSDEFVSYGLGLTIKEIAARADLTFDYARGLGSTNISIVESGMSASAFPELDSTLDSIRVSLRYRRSEVWRWFAQLRYEQFELDDWALGGVAPATIPTVLSLGADPYDYDVWLLSLGFSYSFGERGASGNN